MRPSSCAADGARGLLVALAVTACAGAESIAHLMPPEAPAGARSLLIALGGEASTLRAFDVDEGLGGARVLLPAEVVERGEVQVVFSGVSLEAATLAPGDLPRAAPGRPGRAVLGERGVLGQPLAVHDLVLESREAAWRGGAELRADLLGFEVPTACPVPSRPEIVVPDLGAGPRWAVRVGARAVLARLELLAGPRFLLLGDDGAFEVPPGGLTELRAATLGRDGAVYLAGPGGAVWRGAPDTRAGVTGLERWREGPAGGEPLLLAGSGDDLFLLLRTERGDVAYHHDGVAWAEIATVPRWRKRLEPLGPGEAALLLSPGEGLLVLRRAGIEVTAPADAHVVSMGSVPGFGLVGGADDGRLFGRAAGRWAVLPVPSGRYWVHEVGASGAGLLHLSASGLLASFGPEQGHCAPRAQLPRLGDASMVTIEGGAMIFGQTLVDVHWEAVRVDAEVR
jgi:hypothetical protein